MKIEKYPGKQETLGSFADRNNLIMEVHERPHVHESNNDKWYAHFKHCEIQDGGLLIGSYGNGRTPEDAIINYIPKIVGHAIVINAMDKEARREIYVPLSLLPTW